MPRRRANTTVDPFERSFFGSGMCQVERGSVSRSMSPLPRTSRSHTGNSAHGKPPFVFSACIGTLNQSVGKPLVWSPAFRRSGPAKAGTPNGRFMESKLCNWACSRTMTRRVTLGSASRLPARAASGLSNGEERCSRCIGRFVRRIASFPVQSNFASRSLISRFTSAATRCLTR